MRADPQLLERPPWSALTTAHAAFALGDGLARRYQPAVAPLAAVCDVAGEGLQALHAIMKPGDIAGLFSAEPVGSTEGLKVVANMTVEQMVYDGDGKLTATGELTTLTSADVPDMMRLVELTKPGPFFPRTIELGSYIGVRGGGRLVAMAGERMRFPGFTEISAVCTHPEYRGRGHSTSLVHTLMRAILDRGETPFLHVFKENTRAAALYGKLGFAYRRSLAVTVLKRVD
jgi:ribosomal protein S18 acetylase RimI-like enzyme